MKKQLISAVGVIYVHNLHSDKMEPMIRGEIYHTRKTRILKRRLRETLYELVAPLDGYPVEQVKAEMREHLNNLIQRYYNEPQG